MSAAPAKPRKRILLVVEEDRVPFVHQVFAGYDWIRVVELGEGHPTPPGKRLVSDAAWEVLRYGARISIDKIRKGLQLMGTAALSREHMEPNELWALAELTRRAVDEEDFET